MSFEVTADDYARFMGRYSEPLADQFVELLDLRGAQRAVDVGCGTGALTDRLVSRLGSDGVTAVDPSESFVAATDPASRQSSCTARPPRNCLFPTDSSTVRRPNWSCIS